MSTTVSPIKKTLAAIDAALAGRDAVDLSWIAAPPANDDWPLALDALRFVTSLVRQLKPRHILEFGSGLSTQVLARAAGKGGAISSVDQDPEFGPLAARRLRRQPNVRFQIAPVVARDCGGKLLPVYHWQPKRFASRAPVDIVLIDGPPVVLGGREGTLYQAMDFVRRGTVLLLDDADRTEERATLAHWQESLGDAIEVRRLPGFAKGMAAIIVREPVRRAALWEHRRRLTAGELEVLIPRGQKYLLVDRDHWGDTLAPRRRSVPFLGYAPANDDEAGKAVARLRREAGFLVFAWPSFWWLDYYAGWLRQLRARYRCMLNNDRVVVFDLRTEQAS